MSPQGAFMPRQCWCGRIVDRRGWGSHQRGHDLQGTKDRFWSRVRRTETCWQWIGPLQSNGYGAFYYDNREWRAHRFMYGIIGRRPLPEGMQVDHLCRNRACVRPTHLDLVTPRENTLRGMSPSAIAHRRGTCRFGHPLESWQSQTSQFCRTCRNARARLRRMEMRSA